MTRIGLLAVACAAAAAACSDPTSQVRDALNLDRPVDVAFACYGGLRLSGGDVADPADPITTSAQPETSCDQRSLPPDQGNIPLGQELLLMGNDPGQVDGYAFVLQSVPGTVGIARFPNKQASAYRPGDVLVIDTDPLTPGKNGVTVGDLPVAIATDTVGCHVVTANAGSCDLSEIPINSVLSRPPAPEINRVPVTTATETILAKPAAMLAAPPSGTIGVECPLTPQGLFYVAYPGCHTVAVINGDGVVQQGIKFDAAGVATLVAGDQVSCPVECGDDRDLPTAGGRPVALDAITDPRSGVRRMAIGSEDSSIVTIADIDTTTNLFTTIAQVPLSGDIGLLDVAISPVIGMGGQQGERNDDIAAGGQFQFVYAVATDSSVRVAEIINENRECDTQIDPRFIHDDRNIGDLSCLPVGDPTLPERPLARGPGIQMTGDSVPISVRIFGTDGGDSSQIGTDPESATPSNLIGYFAVIGTSSGGVVLANIDDDHYYDSEDPDDVAKVDVPLAIAHQLRDAIPDRNRPPTQNDTNGVPQRICDTDGPEFDNPDADAGGPRLRSDPSRLINTGFVSQDKTYTLPYFHQLKCVGHDKTMPVSEMKFSAPDVVRELTFPDLRALRKDEEWTLVWEGPVSRDTESQDNDGPPVRIGHFIVGGTGMRVEDPSHPFCSMGIEPHDIVAMRGCDPNVGDAQCPVGYTCYVHPDSQVSSGSCMPSDKIDELSGPCRDFLISIRRYSVASADGGVLKLQQRPRVLRTTPLSGCTSVQQCDALYLEEARQASSAGPGDQFPAPPARTFACEADPTRNGTEDRCVMTCNPTGDSSDCDAGTVCEAVPGNAAVGHCVEGPTPPLQCVEALQRYEVRVSDAFAVIGSTAGFQHPIIEDGTGKCVKDPAASPLMVGRLPLTAPPCTGDGLSDISPNPCSETVTDAYYQPHYQAGTCTPAGIDELVEVDVPSLRFSNPQLTFHVVEPTYPGDAMCKDDRMGGLVDVPWVFPGLTLRAEIVDGLVPKTTGITSATYPVRIVNGPQNSLWVVDEGDFLSTSTSTASTRGKVFRFESVAIEQVNTLQ